MFTFPDFTETEKRLRDPVYRAKILMRTYHKKLCLYNTQNNPKPLRPDKPGLARLLTLMGISDMHLNLFQLTKLNQIFSESS